MSVVLPGSLPTASGWQLIDFRTLRAQSEPAAGGVATVNLPQVAGDEMWLIDHAVIACDSPDATTFRLYESAPLDIYLLDGSRAGNFDVADWPAGLRVEPSQTLVARWDGATDGARGIITVQYRLLRRA